MAKYNYVIKHFKRMCRYYNNRASQNECPLYCKGHGCNISHCRMLAFDDKKFQNVVMTWAETHKEPVYPSWMEYIMDVQHDCVAAYNGGNDTLWKWMWTTPIPADIAEKLGVEPKEG